MIPIPEELLEQVERGNVLLFIGEQLLTDPQGRAILDDLTAEMVARTNIEDSDYINFPVAAQIYEDEHGRNALIQLVRERLYGHGNQPQAVHRLIASLVACRVMVTTTIDQRLEQAFAEAGRPLDVFIDNSDIAFDDARRTDLFMVRGSITRPESLTLTEDDYEIFFETQDNMSVILQGYLARMTILFVGYDLSDPYFKRLYRKVTVSLDDLSRRSYAFGVALSRRVTRWCERYGIEVIDVNAATFLEELSNQLSIREQVDPLVALMKQPAQTTEPLPERPYKLLDFYEPDDVAIFFGRTEESRRLTSMIHAHRLVVLYGASGTGKTSLLLAGIFPRLQQADPPYKIFYVRALEDPTVAIQRTILRHLPAEQSVKTDSLVDFLSAAAQTLNATLLIVLDQFEEFFIRLSPQFRRAFINDLGALYDAYDVPVKAVLSLREDWLASINELEQRIPGIFHNRLRLLPLTREQSREAIVGPAARLGIQYEPELLAHLLDDLMGSEGRSVMPPQLQLICSALYARLKPGEQIIAFSAYQALDGVRGVLQQYLEDELGRLPRDDRALAHATLGELVTSQGTKAVKNAAELALSLDVAEKDLVTVFEQLVRLRLLRTLEHDNGSKAYELAHEYLIREIKLDGEAKQRKEAEELVKQEVDNWQRFGTLLAPDKLALVNDMRLLLRLDANAQALILHSSLQVDYEIDYWLARIDDDQRRLAVLMTAAKSRIAVVRQRAARALGRQASLDAVAPLTKLAIEDHETSVRASARQALAALNPEQQRLAVTQLQAALEDDNAIRHGNTIDALTVLPQVGLPLKLQLQVTAARERLRLAWFAQASVATPTRRAIVMAFASLVILAVLTFTFAVNSYHISTETNGVTGTSDVIINQGPKWLPLSTIARTGVDGKELTVDGLTMVNSGRLWGLWIQKPNGYRQWGKYLSLYTKPRYSLPLQWYLGNKQEALQGLLAPNQLDTDSRRWWVASLGQHGAYDKQFAPQAADKLKSILLNDKESRQLRDQAALSLAQIISVKYYSADQKLVDHIINQVLDDKKFSIQSLPSRMSLLGSIFTVESALIPEELAPWLSPLVKQAIDPRLLYLSESDKLQGAFAELVISDAGLMTNVINQMFTILADSKADRDMRITAADLLQKLVEQEPKALDQEKVDKLIAVLTDKAENIAIRRTINYILANIVSEKSSLKLGPLTKIFIGFLGDEDEEVRSSSIQVLGNLLLNYNTGDSQIVDKLLVVLTNGHENDLNRELALWQIEAIMAEKPEYATLELFNHMVNWLTNAPNISSDRARALDMLGVLLRKNSSLDFQFVFEQAIAFLSDPNEPGETRAAAAGLIGDIVQLQTQYAAESTVDVLIPLLSDDIIGTNYGFRMASPKASAVSALAQVAEVNPELRSQVIGLLSEQLIDQDVEVRNAVQGALAEIYAVSKPEESEYLFKQLVDPEALTKRNIAMHALFLIALRDSARHAEIDSRLNIYANSDEPIARIWANKTRQLLELAELGNRAVVQPSQRTMIENQLRSTQGFYVQTNFQEPYRLTFFGEDHEWASDKVLNWIDEQFANTSQSVE